MKIPERLIPLIQANLIDTVTGQLQSGKEAEVYVISSSNRTLCAKVYKDKNSRTFKQRTKYTEGRKVRSSRRARAIEKKSRYGQKESESEWQNTEVDALMLLGSAGVSVPKPYEYYEGVLLMEMVVDDDGDPAPRLKDIKLTKEKALKYWDVVIRQSVLMLCSGIVHGDFSEYNILVAKGELVIIDLPQSVQSTANNAYDIFERDLIQLAAFFGQYAPEILETNYPMEIWTHYKNGKLKPNTKLTGKFTYSKQKANVQEVLDEIESARDDEMERREFKE